VDSYSAAPRRKHKLNKALRYGMRSQGISQFYLHICVHPLTQWTTCQVPLPSQLKLVLIYRPRMDVRLSWPGPVS